ncbi:mitogen-activated protein kinase kinase kinase 20-like [Salvia divinorum]|uniref:Mitogen-activated protein kinase kinase kinase 20-like n=1 Tax=Salvia divinorum TaxID=28513 RepID=A0ABD1HZT4_SALDI
MHWTRGKTLGSGGFGFVSIATTHRDGGHNPHIPAVVAVKSTNISQSKSLSMEKDLLHKFKSCPCILRCFGDQITTENGRNLYNIILEYAPGGSLADKILSKGLPEDVVSHHAKSIATALVHIHKHGYVHCDVKPQNVLLVGEDAKLADFGSCKKIGDSVGEQQGFRGTVLYAAPESISRLEYSAATDVWALGCTVLSMLTGRAPWEIAKGATATDVLMMIGCSDRIPEIPNVVSKEARDFLRKCFVKNPAARCRAESLLRHPFLKMGARRRRHHHHGHHPLSSKLQSLLPQCFHVPKIHVH